MRRPRLKRLAVVAAILGLLAGVGLLADRYATRRADERRLDGALARLDADDPDWRVGGVVKAHNAAIPDDAENATVAGLDALARCGPSWHARQRALTPDGIPDLVWDDDRLPHDDAFCSLYEVYLETLPAQLDAVATRRLPAGGLPLHFAEPNPFGTLLPNAQNVRAVARVLRDYATVEAYFGRGDEAVRAADAGVHFAQVSLATEPTLISQLVRFASLNVTVGGLQQTLAWTEPAAGLAELQVALARASAGGIYPALRGERAGIMRIYENVRSGALPADILDDTAVRGGTPTLFTRFVNRFRRRNLMREQYESLGVLNEFLDAAKLAGPARRHAADAAEASPVAKAVMPVFTKCVAADDLCASRLLCASVGLACERYRRQFGHFPDALADIPAAILPAVPTDPFSGKPLLYKRLADGAVVHSVGPDGTHDGGAAGPTEATPKLTRLLSFRLWNPDARRRPPTPRPEPEPDPDELPDLRGEP